MTESPATPTMPRAPAGLGGRGRSLWRSVVRDFDLATSELEILVLASRTLDRVAALEEELKGAPAVVLGSQGQPRPNPLAAELRAEVLLASKLVQQLGLPTDIDDDGLHGSWQGLSPSERGRKAARRRWQGRGG